MKTFNVLLKRNTKLFFKDKAMFFTSLITPAILLVLYSTFLGKVFRDSFKMSLPQGFEVTDKLINGTVAGQLMSSLLSVSCVTVAFCSNMLMVQDKVNNSRKDLTISPVKRSTLALSYYAGAFISTFIVCAASMVLCLVYTATQGWYMSVSDIILLLLDVFLLVLFGTALSSIINVFLNTQGQISAVGTIVSSGYGFISGAYMPISQFPEGLQKVIYCLPGTYATSLMRNHSMRGAYAAMLDEGIPQEAIDGMKKAVDCTVKAFGHKFTIAESYIILVTTIIFLIAVYVIINMLRKKS